MCRVPIAAVPADLAGQLVEQPGRFQHRQRAEHEEICTGQNHQATDHQVRPQRLGQQCRVDRHRVPATDPQRNVEEHRGVLDQIARVQHQGKTPKDGVANQHTEVDDLDVLGIHFPQLGTRRPERVDPAADNAVCR